MVNNPTYFRDFMNSLYEGEGEFFQTKQKGKITDSTKGILKKYNSIENGNILDRFQYYLARFRNIIGNNDIDFTKPHHLLNSQIKYEYSPNARTRLSMFNLIGQSPVEMLKNIARQRYSSQSWLRIIGGITGAVFGLAFISQLFFGKLTNSSNLKKQVNLYADNK